MLALLLRKLWFFLVLPRRNLHNRESPWNNPNASTSPPPPSREQSFSETCLLLLDRAPTDRTIEPRLMLITRPPHHRDFSLPSLCPLDNASSFTETIISPLWGGGAIEFRLTCSYIGETVSLAIMERSRTDQLDRWCAHTLTHAYVASRRRSITRNRCQRRLFSGSIFEGQVRAGCCCALSTPYALYCSSLKCADTY